MKAVALTEFGEPDVLSVQELPDPLVGPDFVLLQVRAAGVNPVDWKIQKYAPPLVEQYPSVGGIDGSGIVEEVGAEVTNVVKGDKV